MAILHNAIDYRNSLRRNKRKLSNTNMMEKIRQELGSKVYICGFNWKVKNIKGTSNESKYFKDFRWSWIKHWEHITQEKRTECCIKDCYNKEKLVGGHLYVKQLNTKRHFHYIAPICHTHNMSSIMEQEWHNIKRKTKIVKIKYYDPELYNQNNSILSCTII